MEAALFQDLGNSLATFDASRWADYYGGCLPGNDVQMANAIQAYVQAKLSGVLCRVELPDEAWHPSANKHKFRRPVCRLVKALGQIPTMRHLERTHGISIGWMHATFQEGYVSLAYKVTAKMAANSHTKSFKGSVSWTHACQLINVSSAVPHWFSGQHGSDVPDSFARYG